jgi:hypothetical protein
MDGRIIARLGIFWFKNRKQAVIGVVFNGLVGGAPHLNIHEQSQREKIGDQR